MLGQFFKQKPTDSIWWVREIGTKGKLLFSFDKKKVFNFFRDYPEKLTPEQKALFDKENPELADFYAGKFKSEGYE